MPCGSTAYLALSDSVTTDPVHRRKKLIEVAIPLEAINAHPCEKSFRHGRPSTFHLWRARRPLAAARAVILLPDGGRPLSGAGRVPYRGSPGERTVLAIRPDQ